MKRKSVMKSLAIALSLAILTIVLPSAFTMASASKMNGKCCQSSDGGRSYRYRMAMQRAAIPHTCTAYAASCLRNSSARPDRRADVRYGEIAMPADGGLCRPLQRHALRRHAEDVTASCKMVRCLLLLHSGIRYVDTHRPRARIPRQLEWQLGEALSQRARASPA